MPEVLAPARPGAGDQAALRSWCGSYFPIRVFATTALCAGVNAFPILCIIHDIIWEIEFLQADIMWWRKLLMVLDSR